MKGHEGLGSNHGGGVRVHAPRNPAIGGLWGPVGDADSGGLRAGPVEGGVEVWEVSTGGEGLRRRGEGVG